MDEIVKIYKNCNRIIKTLNNMDINKIVLQKFADKVKEKFVPIKKIYKI